MAVNINSLVGSGASIISNAASSSSSSSGSSYSPGGSSSYSGSTVGSSGGSVGTTISSGVSTGGSTSSYPTSASSDSLASQILHDTPGESGGSGTITHINSSGTTTESVDSYISNINSGGSSSYSGGSTGKTSGSATGINKISESEFNRSSSMQKQYGSYQNYLNAKVTSYTDENGVVTTNVKTPDGSFSSTTIESPNSKTPYIQEIKNGDTTSANTVTRNDNGSITQTSYVNGDVSQKTTTHNPDGSSDKQTYSNGHLQTQEHTYPNGDTVKETTFANGVKSTVVTDKQGNTTTTTINNDGSTTVATLTNTDGTIDNNSSTYDSNGVLTKVTSRRVDSTGNSLITTTFNDDGTVTVTSGTGTYHYGSVEDYRKSGLTGAVSTANEYNNSVLTAQNNTKTSSTSTKTNMGVFSSANLLVNKEQVSNLRNSCNVVSGNLTDLISSTSKILESINSTWSGSSKDTYYNNAVATLQKLSAGNEGVNLLGTTFGNAVTYTTETETTISSNI